MPFITFHEPSFYILSHFMRIVFLRISMVNSKFNFNVICRFSFQHKAPQINIFYYVKCLQSTFCNTKMYSSSTFCNAKMYSPSTFLYFLIIMHFLSVNNIFSKSYFFIRFHSCRLSISVPQYSHTPLVTSILASHLGHLITWIPLSRVMTLSLWLREKVSF